MLTSQMMQLMLVSYALSCQLEDFGSDVLHQQPGQLRSQVQVGWALLPNYPPWIECPEAPLSDRHDICQTFYPTRVIWPNILHWNAKIGIMTNSRQNSVNASKCPNLHIMWKSLHNMWKLNWSLPILCIFFAKIIKIYTAHKNQPNINSAKRLLLFSIEQNTNLWLWLIFFTNATRGGVSINC